VKIGSDGAVAGDSIGELVDKKPLSKPGWKTGREISGFSGIGFFIGIE